MAITYTWDFPSLDVVPSLDGLTDVVSVVHWVLTADDGDGHSAAVHGTFDTPLDPGADFTPFADLTPGLVEAWASDRLSVDALSDGLAKQLAEQLAPAPTTNTLAPPWAAP